MQSAKPRLTTGLDLNNSELDPSDGKITIAWFDAPGYVQGYRVQLFDGSTLLSRSHPGSLYNTFFLSDLKSGYTYTIAIEAKSEQYYERIIEYGDAFTAQFNTTVKVPGPPREGSCISSTETSITLLWLPPSDPNGEVTRYNIHVYRESKLEFTLSTTGNETVHTVDGLFPGTDYLFRVHTENEQYNSTSYAVIDSDCKTNGKLSGPPTDLKIIDHSSLGFTITWNEPVNTYDEYISGYVINIKIDHVCVEEVIYTCKRCLGDLECTMREYICQRKVIYTSLNLTGIQWYPVFRLIPNTTYTVTVSAVNSLGKGTGVIITQMTNKEVIGTDKSVMNEVHGNVLSQHDPIYVNESIMMRTRGTDEQPNFDDASVSEPATGYERMTQQEMSDQIMTLCKIL